MCLLEFVSKVFVCLGDWLDTSTVVDPSMDPSIIIRLPVRYLGQDPLPSWWRKLPLPVLTKVTAWEPRCHWSACMHAASGYAYAHIKLQFEGTRQLEHEPISNLPLFVNIEPRHLVQISQPWKTYKGYESLSKSTDGVCKFLCAIFVYPFNNRNVLSIHASSLVTGLESTVTVTGSGSLFFRYYI